VVKRRCPNSPKYAVTSAAPGRNYTGQNMGAGIVKLWRKRAALASETRLEVESTAGWPMSSPTMPWHSVRPQPCGSSEVFQYSPDERVFAENIRALIFTTRNSPAIDSAQENSTDSRRSHCLVY